MNQVPSQVLEAFGAQAPGAQLLSGGLGPAYRAGKIVLKPVEDEVEARVAAEAMSTAVVDSARVRLARPVQSRTGAWVVDGWTACEFVAGSHLEGPHPWSSAVSAIDALCEGLRSASVEVPLGRRDHRWAVADRVAWDEQSVELHPRIEALCRKLRLVTPSCDAPAQLVHGDLARNLLFEPGLPPAVIDFSPYIRPAPFALAVYVIDAIGWHDAGEDLLRLVRGDSVLRACLPRAGIFRLVALDGFRREDGVDIVVHLPRYEHICSVISETLRRL